MTKQIVLSHSFIFNSCCDSKTLFKLLYILFSFSFVDYAPPGAAFIGLCLAIRLVDALGASAYLTASYTTLGSELSDIIGRAMVCNFNLYYKTNTCMGLTLTS